MRKAIPSVVPAVLAGLSLSLSHGLCARAAEPSAPGVLTTAPAEVRTVSREYRLDAVVEAVNRTTVSAQTQGQVEAILFDVDDYVDKGAVVARLKDTEHRARVAQAEADVQSASARLEQTREAHARVQGLYARKSVSESDMDRATADLATARATLDAATARLGQAREQLQYTLIRAPYSGIVTHRHMQVGEMASPGQPVMTGVSLDELRVIADVPQSVIPSVRNGAAARVYLPDGRVVESRDITVFPFADLGSNTFKVRVALPPSEDGVARSLFPGMYVKTGFAVGEKQELTVPKQSVVQRSEVTAVYVVTPGDHVHFRQIRLGRALDDAWVVLSGLTAGEPVALDPIAAGVLLKTQTPVRHVSAPEAPHG
jgi:RND family efflux transporter MFP subunit